MCDTSFALGQRGSYFFQCPSQTTSGRLPKSLKTTLASKHVEKIHHVTLGLQDSFLATYDESGNAHMVSQDLPTELTNFVFAKDSFGSYVRDVPRLRVTLGPYNTSFIAHDGSAFRWMNLPSRLLQALQARLKNGVWTDKPRLVVLGADGNFLLITEKHAAIWDLSHYRTLSKLLEFSRTQEKGIEEIHNVVLHPYRYEAFVAHSRNGTLIHENLPPHSVMHIEGMRELIQKDTKELARRRNAEQQRRSSKAALARQATFKREWSGRNEQFRQETKGYQLKLSLSLKVSAGGLAKLLG